jgi:hypothetical protein
MKLIETPNSSIFGQLLKNAQRRENNINATTSQTSNLDNYMKIGKGGKKI